MSDSSSLVEDLKEAGAENKGVGFEKTQAGTRSELFCSLISRRVLLVTSENFKFGQRSCWIRKYSRRLGTGTRDLGLTWDPACSFERVGADPSSICMEKLI